MSALSQNSDIGYDKALELLKGFDHMTYTIEFIEVPLAVQVILLVNFLK